MMIKSNIVLFSMALMLSSCGVSDGPSDSDAEKIAQKSMMKMGSTASDWKEIVGKGIFKNKGCEINKQMPGVYVCEVSSELDLPGYGKKQQDIPVVAVKKPDGSWVGIDDCRENSEGPGDC